MATSTLAQNHKYHDPTAPGSVFAQIGVWNTFTHLWVLPVARVSVLLFTDLIALLVSGLLGYLLWARLAFDQPLAVYVDLLPLFLLFPAAYAAAGLYPGFGIGAVEILRRCFCWTSATFLVLAAATFLLKLPSDYSRLAFVIAWALALVWVPFLRFLVLCLVRRWRWWAEPAVLIGSERWVQRAVQSLHVAVSLGYRPVVALASSSRQGAPLLTEVPLLGELELSPRLAESGVRVALVEESIDSGAIVNLLQQHFHFVVMIREYSDLPVEPVRTRNFGGLLGVEFTNNLLLWRNRFIKRLLDIVGGGVLLGLAAPLLLIGGLLVKLASRGPMFFRQEREGLNGETIWVWKLRTMYIDAEQRLVEYLAHNPQLRQEWETHFKLARDPRVLPGVGVLLRRFSLDELPQLWSVMIGKMSLIGPRPFPEYHLREFPPEFRELRRRVRPGLSGLWQVMVRSSGDINEQRAYDTYYIRNWSLWLDLYILARTIVAVLSGRGAS
jgi:Undecaprenyl-phosphate galactose phosphotransferase WbaP